MEAIRRLGKRDSFPKEVIEAARKARVPCNVEITVLPWIAEEKGVRISIRLVSPRTKKTIKQFEDSCFLPHDKITLYEMFCGLEISGWKL